MSDIRMDILKFRASPRGYYYGGVSHFKEEVIRIYRDMYSDIALKLGENLPPELPIAPIIMNILLDDNTGMMALVYPENKSHEQAIAKSFKEFMINREEIFKDNLQIKNKVVAVIICAEMSLRKVDQKELTDEEIREQIADFVKGKPESKESVLMFDIQQEASENDEFIIYKTGPLGTTELQEAILKSKATSVKSVWGNLFEPGEKNSQDAGHFATPEQGVEFVSKTIKDAIKNSAELSKLQDSENEDKATPTFGSDSGSGLDIDISDLFKPKSPEAE